MPIDIGVAAPRDTKWRQLENVGAELPAGEAYNVKAKGEAGVPVLELASVEGTLEDAYLALTADETQYASRPAAAERPQEV